MMKEMGKKENKLNSVDGNPSIIDQHFTLRLKVFASLEVVENLQSHQIPLTHTILNYMT